MLAAIDAGSNTLRLLIGRTVEGKVVPELYLRSICRLAGGFTNEKGLSPEARERTLFAFQEFARVCQQHKVNHVRAVGTAAFRQAVNGVDFASEIRAVTSVPLEIISGDLEAKTMIRGVLSTLDPLPDHALVIDIGGGSTEFVLCFQQEILWSRSLPLGVVRLSETCANVTEQAKVIIEILAGLVKDLVETCSMNHIDPRTLTLVGTAGTVTTLAALDMQMHEYDWQRVNNYKMPYENLKTWQDTLAPMSPTEREALPGMEPGRGDLIVAGLEIVLCLMRLLKSDVLTVCDFGILEGLLLSLESPE